jgi:DNA-binding transcriptional ArsR family regulator
MNEDSMIDDTLEIDGLERQAEQVAGVMKSLSNPRRLLLLCKLVEAGRMSVGELARSIGLSQSALSQHLALMRDDGLVAFDREGQTLFYRIADQRVEALLATLYHLYCTPPGGEG